MNKPPICQQCGAHLPEDAPAGLCPNCLVRAGFESEGQAKPQIAPTAPSPASPRFQPPSVEELAGRFPQLEILALLGIGGMGAVYKARQKELDRMVAVKILPPEVSADPAFAERFTREARALARLSHPNIIAVHDFGRASALPSPVLGRWAGGEGGAGEGSDSPLFYFVMEYVDGANLRQAIQSGGMSPKEALAIVPQICDALQFAHDEGIVHRDIKPENILVDKRGRVKIADFGLAKLLGQTPDDVSLTGTQQVMGTLRYMAPEQMEGTKAVDHRADIYSLGVVFYELLTGELPVGRFAPPSKKVEIDVRLDEVVLRALEKEPEQRYQHASEVKTDMESIAGSPAQAPAAASVGVLSGPTLLLDETDRAARRYQHFLLLGGIAWIVLGVILALLPMPVLLPISLVLGIGGIAMMVAASRNRQQWEIEYLGHSLRFENSVYTSGRLIIDGKTMAAGGVGLSTKLSARIPRGLGEGDRIVVKTNAGLLSFRCRIFVEPKAASAPVSYADAKLTIGTKRLGTKPLFAAAVLVLLGSSVAAWYAWYPLWTYPLSTRLLGAWDGACEGSGSWNMDVKPDSKRGIPGGKTSALTRWTCTAHVVFKHDGTYSWSGQNVSDDGMKLGITFPGDQSPPAQWKVVGEKGTELRVEIFLGEATLEFHGEDEFTMAMPNSPNAADGEFTFHRADKSGRAKPNPLAGSIFSGVAVLSLALILGMAIGGRGRRNREVAHLTGVAPRAPNGGYLAGSPTRPTKARMVVQLGLGATSAVAVLAAGWLSLHWPWPTALETRILGNWAGNGETFGRAKIEGGEWQGWTQCKESVTATFKSDGTYTWWQQSEFKSESGPAGDPLNRKTDREGNLLPPNIISFGSSGNKRSSKTTLSLPKPGDPPAHWRIVAVKGSTLYVKLDGGPHVMEGGFEFHGENEFTMKLPESENARGGYTFHRLPQPESAEDHAVHLVVFVLGYGVFIFSVTAMIVALVSLFRRPANRQPLT
jgi:hypothetical protein